MYHVNTVTGEHGTCRAQTPESCTFAPAGQVDHHEDMEESFYQSETILSAVHHKHMDGLRRERLMSTQPKINHDYPIPEAHRLEKVDKMLNRLELGMSANEIQGVLKEADGENYKRGNSERGAMYYADAACWLGLTESVEVEKGRIYGLTDAGRAYVQSDRATRQRIVRELLESNEFYQASALGIEASMAYQERNGSESENTRNRKASSMASWVNQLSNPDFLEELPPAEHVTDEPLTGVSAYKGMREREVSGPLKRGEVCEDCYTEKSLDGVCFNCD